MCKGGQGKDLDVVVDIKKTMALGWMTWKKGLWCAYQKLPLFNWGLTNQGIVLKTTPMNSCGAWQDLTKGEKPMLGVAMKTYTRAVDTKKEREWRCWQTGYMPTCLSKRESRRRRRSVSRGVNAISMKRTYEDLLNWGYVRSDTVYRCWVEKRKSLRQHELDKSEKH